MRGGGGGGCGGGVGVEVFIQVWQARWTGAENVINYMHRVSCMIVFLIAMKERMLYQMHAQYSSPRTLLLVSVVGDTGLD